MSLLRSAATLQRSYCHGEGNYPRTEATELSEQSALMLTRYAKSQGISMIRSLPVMESDSPYAHEALAPTQEGLKRVDLDAPRWMLSDEDRVVTEITRQLLRAGHPIKIQKPKVDHLPEWAQELNWSRPADALAEKLATTREYADYADYWTSDHDHNVPVEIVAKDTHAQSTSLSAISPRLVRYPAAEVAYRSMAAHGLGRPATRLGLANKAVKRGLVNEHGITKEGRRWLSNSPPVFRMSGTSRLIERKLSHIDKETDNPPPSEHGQQTVHEMVYYENQDHINYLHDLMYSIDAYSDFPDSDDRELLLKEHRDKADYNYHDAMMRQLHKKKEGVKVKKVFTQSNQNNIQAQQAEPDLDERVKEDRVAVKKVNRQEQGSTRIEMKTGITNKSLYDDVNYNPGFRM